MFGQSRLVVLVLLLASLVTLAAAADPQPPTPPKAPLESRRKRVAVVNFEVPQEVYRGWGHDGEAAAARLGAVLSDMFITALVQAGTFDVIERTELEKVLKEQQLNAQGLLDPATAPKAAKILGVNLILGGKITEFGVKTKSGGGLGAVTGGLLGVDMKKSTARVAVDARMIDTTTAKIIFAEKSTGENSESSLSFGGTDFAHFLAAVNFQSEEWTNSRIGRATRTAVDQIVEKVIALYPVEANVLTVLPDGGVILDMGRFSGVKVDDQFDLSRVSITKDEDTGEVVWEDRKALGTLKVVEVQDSRCKCVPVGALSETAKKGDVAILKRVEEKKDPKKK